MKYSFDFLHHELMQYRSLNYEQYKSTTEVNLLQNLLKYEEITDYHEVEWDAFIDDLIGELPQPTRREIAKDFTLKFAPKTKLEAFVKSILPREETVRVLTFLRDNYKQCLFNHPYYFYNVKDETEKTEWMIFFENDCARLISKNIEDSKRDTFGGRFGELPRPNLRQIALGEKTQPKLTAEEKIIIDAIPTYPGDKKAIPKEDILAEAKEQVRLFSDQVARYNLDKQEKDKPCMSQKNYVEPIWNNLQARANRYLYFDKNPAYQVLWVMGVLMRLPNKKHDWWTENFADNIVNYLDCTKFLCDTKKDMDNAIAQIRRLTELSLFDEPAIVPQTKKTIKCSAHSNMDAKRIAEEIVKQMQQRENTQPLQVNMHFGNVKQVIGNVENYNCTKQDE